MAESEDVVMAEASSQSQFHSRASSLSPPPSSPPDSFGDFDRIETGRQDIDSQDLDRQDFDAPDADEIWKAPDLDPDPDIVAPEISLDCITLATPVQEVDQDNSNPMAQTRGNTAAAKKARTPGNDKQQPTKATPKKAGVRKAPTEKAAAKKGTTKKGSDKNSSDDTPAEKPAPKKPGAASPKKPTRRSTRGKKTSEDEPVVPKTTAKPIKKPVGSKKKKWTAERLLTDPKSPLVEADIRAMLCKPAAWNILTLEEKIEIAQLMPPSAPMINADSDDMRPNIILLACDDNFRADCATYADQLRLGQHDPDWIREAFTAHEERLKGTFDGYVKTKFAEEWGEEWPAGDVEVTDEAEDASKSTRPKVKE